MARQIVVKLVVMAASTLIGACSRAPAVSEAKQAPPSSLPETSSAAQAPREPATQSSDILRFIREESGRRQSLELRKRSGGGFDVAISVAGSCSRTEAGSAKAVKTEGDGEVRVDPDGEGHPVDTFALAARDKCRITIELADPERDYAWLRESGCSSACPLSTKAMTRK
jgi:hypothetical protein